MSLDRLVNTDPLRLALAARIAADVPVTVALLGVSAVRDIFKTSIVPAMLDVSHVVIFPSIEERLALPVD